MRKTDRRLPQGEVVGIDDPARASKLARERLRVAKADLARLESDRQQGWVLPHDFETRKAEAVAAIEAARAAVRAAEPRATGR